MNATLRRLSTSPRWPLAAIVVVAFAARLGYRLSHGEAAFLEHGYTFYLDLADSYLRGYGFCFPGGVDCAVRVPVYPLFLSFFLERDWLYPGLPMVQAAISASRCLIAYGIGATLFDRRAGLIAAGLAAINPYSVVHSTALQDTSLFNVLTGLAIYLLLRSRAENRGAGFRLLAGTILAAATLTTVRLILFVPLALAWVALPSGADRRWRFRDAALVAIPVLLMVGGWTLRNWYVVGTPVLTTESGISLWVANNAATFEFLPDRSVDEIAAVAYERLPESRQRQLDATGDAVESNRLLTRWALEYMREHPWQTLVNMIRKVAWSFSGQLSPAQGWLRQVGYAAFIVPLHVLALIGWWSRPRQDDTPTGHLLVALLFVAFVVTTAVFWAHTSHKSTLHSFLCVYAGFALAQWQQRAVGGPASPATPAPTPGAAASRSRAS